MSKHYPRVERERFHPKGKKKLKCISGNCLEPVTRRITIQNSWFRGEDGQSHYACDAHGKKYRGKNSIPNPYYITDNEFLATFQP